MSENLINENIYLFLFLSFLTFILLTIYKKISLRLKLLDNPSKDNIHKFPTPTGAGIVFSIIILSISLLKYYSNFFDSYGELNRFYLFIITILIYTIMCFYDDFKQMHVLTKFCFQVILVYIALPLLVINTDLNIIKIIPLKLLMLILIISWIYIINIHNFIDGLDGFFNFAFIVFFFSKSNYIFLFRHSKLQFFYLINIFGNFIAIFIF